MTLTCGTTNDGCSGKTGLIRIEYTIPDPPYVRYKYPSGNWINVIGGVRYTFENKTEPIFTPGIEYWVGVRWVCHAWNEQHIVETYPSDPYRGMWIGNREPYTSGGARDAVYMPIEGIVTDPSSKEYVLRCANAQGVMRSVRFNGHHDAPVNTNETNLDWRSHRRCPVTPSITGYYRRSNNQPVSTKTICVFRVFNANNQIIFEQTDSICPTAEVVPSVYGNNKGGFNVKSSSSQVLKVINIETNNIKTTLIQLGTTTIKKLDSPASSTLFPKVCWDCDEDKCPEGTCEVDCGAHICCYDKNGIAVKTILKS